MQGLAKCSSNPLVDAQGRLQGPATHVAVEIPFSGRLQRPVKHNSNLFVDAQGKLQGQVKHSEYPLVNALG